MDAEPDTEMAKLTGEWFPVRPKAYEKSVVLGGGRNLFPCPDPAGYAAILGEHIRDVARRAFMAGKRAAKAEVRKVLWE